MVCATELHTEVFFSIKLMKDGIGWYETVAKLKLLNKLKIFIFLKCPVFMHYRK